MKADFSDITSYVLERGNVLISYNLEFELQEARVKAQISLDEFNRMPGTPRWMSPEDSMSKCHLIVWYRLHSRIDAVQDSASIRKQKKSQKTNFQWR